MLLTDRAPSLDLRARRYFHGASRLDRSGTPASGAEIVVDFMRLVGVKVIFGIPGGASLPLNDAFTAAHHADGILYVLTGHEQGAAFEAEGYGAASGRPGFCTATSGPGATNLITGLADATRDSRPVFAVTGNAATTAEAEAFQAIDIARLTSGTAAKLALRPDRADLVQDALVRAFHACVTGRPGAVLVDLPKDVQVATAVVRPWSDLLDRLDWAPPEPDSTALDEAAALLRQAERPIIYAGHGVVLAEAAPELAELARRLACPVVTTLHGLGLLPADDRLNLGMIGMHGTVVANIAPHLADVVLAVGVRFDDRVVGTRPSAFAPTARIIHIDVDAHQLDRVRQVDLAIHADLKPALSGLVTRAADWPAPDRSTWLARLDAIAQAMPTQSYECPESDELCHEAVYRELTGQLSSSAVEDIVATFDVGTHQMKGAQWFPVARPRSFITSGGMGSMGCALPLAAGAALARPDATVLAFCGDGGFVMSSHELDTIGGYRLPVKIIVVDDQALGMVTNWHGLFFGGRTLTSDRRRGRAATRVTLDDLRARIASGLAAAVTTDQAVNALAAATADLAAQEGHQFALAAAAHGIPSERIQSRAELPGAIERCLGAPGPYLLHVLLPRPCQVYPLIQPGTTPDQIVWRETFPGSGIPVPAAERFDYTAGTLRAAE